MLTRRLKITLTLLSLWSATSLALTPAIIAGTSIPFEDESTVLQEKHKILVDSFVHAYTEVGSLNKKGEINHFLIETGSVSEPYDEKEALKRAKSVLDEMLRQGVDETYVFIMLEEKTINLPGHVNPSVSIQYCSDVFPCPSNKSLKPAKKYFEE